MRHSRGEGFELLCVPILNPGHERHHLIIVKPVLVEVPFLYQDSFPIMWDKHRYTWNVWCPEGPWQIQCKASRQRQQPPLHICVLWPILVRNQPEAPCQDSIPRAARSEDLWPRQANMLPRIHGLSEWLLHSCPIKFPPAGIVREVGGHVVIDLVFIAHVLNNLIPEDREGSLCRLTVMKHFHREPLRNLRDTVFLKETPKMPAALVEGDNNSQDAATQAEPKLGIGDVLQKSCADEKQPLNHVLIPMRAKGIDRQLLDALLAKTTNHKLVHRPVQGRDPAEAQRRLQRQKEHPKEPPQRCGSARCWC
mmetsp:Transcript_106485/g.266882  ORF Transcript_106485/g.266882 Transcript_106485/m.266882 type:complete len:308 (+) Transcript_106485:386-1309(+)